MIDIGKPSLFELNAELGEEMNSKFRAAIIRIIGHVGDIHSLKRLIPFLLDPYESVAGEAFRAILRIGGPAAETQVLSKLVDLEVSRDFFKERVVDFGHFKTSPWLSLCWNIYQTKDLLQNTHTRISNFKSFAPFAASNSKSRGRTLRATQSQRGFLGLRKGNEKLKVSICKALGTIGAPDAESALKKAKKSRHKIVKSAAEEALLALEKKSGRTKGETQESLQKTVVEKPAKPRTEEKTIAPTVAINQEDENIETLNTQIPISGEDSYPDVSPDDETREISPLRPEDAVFDERPDNQDDITSVKEPTDFDPFLMDDAYDDSGDRLDEMETEYGFESFETEAGQSMKSAIGSIESELDEPAGEVRIIHVSVPTWPTM